MRQVFNLMFILILTLGLVACNTSNNLKNSLEEGSGWGDVVLNQNSVTIDDALNVTSGALNFTKSEVTVDGKKALVGAPIKNVKSGKKPVTLSVPSLDGKMIYSGIGILVVKAGVLTEISVKLDTARAATNSYKFIFNPADYGITGAAADALKDVHLVGKLPLSDWKPLEKNYPLVKQADGKWTGIFEISENTEFKFIFDPVPGSTEWTNAKGYENHKDKNALMTKYPALAWGNYKVFEMPGIVESVLAWKFIFNPADYSITGAAADALKDIHLVGKLPLSDWKPLEKNYPLVKQADGKWTGIFEISENTEFKFIFDPVPGSTEWANAKGYENHKDKNALMAQYPALAWGNYKVFEMSSIVTQKF